MRWIAHTIQCVLLLSHLSISVYLSYLSSKNSVIKQDELFNQTSAIYTVILRYIIYGSQLVSLLGLPQLLCNFFGLLFFNAFKPEPELKNKDKSLLSRLPHICFRTVTRGNFPELIRRGLKVNLVACQSIGLSNCTLQILTDNKIDLFTTSADYDKSSSNNNLTRNPIIEQLVVPSNYKTSTGALFKARALQYALEPNVNKLAPGDYIVHLDEETLLTPGAIKGIINFIEDGKHSFGQGMITYVSQGIVNPITTLLDAIRVAEDLGKIRFELKAFHKPIWHWKGSFCVSRVEAELDVTYDHGIDGSIAEDAFFSFIAMQKGYSFDFIEGEMLEKSAYTILDLIKQRKRWIQGVWLVIHSKKIFLYYKILDAMSLYCWILLPVATFGVIASLLVSTVTLPYVNLISTFCGSQVVYLYVFGMFRSFYGKPNNKIKIVILTLLSIFSPLVSMIVENVAVIWAHISPKHRFYIVDKS